MAKPKTKHRSLPSRMIQRSYKNKQGDVWIGYYYEHPRDPAGKRKVVPLGSDLAEAKKKWAELEGMPPPIDSATVEGVWEDYILWAEKSPEADITARTIKDRRAYWRELKPVFGATAIDALLPGHIQPYFDARSSKVSAKKELKFLGTMCNWARARGKMKAPNPTIGLMRGLKVDESRNVYVEDADLDRVYRHAGDIVRDCLDLAYLTGQRPADVRKMRWDQIVEGRLEVKQNKTGAKIRIAIVGELKAVIDRARERTTTLPCKSLTILADPDGMPLKEFGYFRSQFDKARDAAGDRS
ncbi:MAG: hypothetical protein ACRYGK_01570 [Janthinobacterium lividum]